MIDYAPNEVSQFATPPHQIRRWRDGDRTPMGDHRTESALTTEALQSGTWRFTRVTGAVSGEQTQTVVESVGAVWQAERDPLEAATEDRIRLLAKKFESGIDREELARLEILTLRLDRLVPQVTEQDVRMLEQMAERIEGLQVEIDRLARLGLGR